MRVLVRTRRPNRVRIAARPADMAPTIGLPADRPATPAGVVRPDGPAARVSPSGVRHETRRRPIVIERAGPHGDDHATRSVSPGHLDISAPRRDAGAHRRRDPSPERRARGHTSRADGDHPAKGVGAVCDRARAAGDLDAADGRRIEEGRVGSCASLGRDAGAVEQDQRAASRQPPDGRHGALALRDEADTRNVLQGLAESDRRALLHVRARQQGGRCAGGDVDCRSDAHDGDGFCDRGLRDERQASARRPRRQSDGSRDPSIGQDDHDGHGRGRRCRPAKASGAIRALGAAIADDCDLGAGNGRQATRVDHQAAYRLGRRGRRQGQKSQDRERMRCHQLPGPRRETPRRTRTATRVRSARLIVEQVIVAGRVAAGDGASRRSASRRSIDVCRIVTRVTGDA